jgi:ubiquitin-protein ligase
MTAQLEQEWKDWEDDPLPFCSVEQVSNDLFHWKVILKGPVSILMKIT